MFSILLYFVLMATKEQISAINTVALRNLVIQAQRENFWLFDSVTKEWFSPEEFEKFYGSKELEESWYIKIKVLNPSDGLKGADIQIQKIVAKRSILQDRIIKYYQTQETKGWQV